MKSSRVLSEILEEHKGYKKRNATLEESNRALREEVNKWKKKARYDDLTGLLRRKTFDSFLSKLLERSKKFKQPLSLLMVDIDYFKKVNDTYGHDVGDTVLQEVSKALNDNVRGSDFASRKIVGRLGGEEIMVALPNTGTEGAKIVGERLRTAISDLKFKNKGLKITISTGISTYHPGKSLEENLAEQLYKTADEKLYEAKEAGRNRVVY